MVEIEGMLKYKPISIPIDPGAHLSYVLPRIVQLYISQQHKFENSWLVQLATCTKRKVTSFMKMRDFIMDGLKKTCWFKYSTSRILWILDRNGLVRGT